MTAIAETLAKTASRTGRTSALMSASRITASTSVLRLSMTTPGMIAAVSNIATVPTTSETMARLISARRPGRHFQSSSTCSR